MAKATQFTFGKLCCFWFPPGYARRAYRERRSSVTIFVVSLANLVIFFATILGSATSGSLLLVLLFSDFALLEFDLGV